MSTLPTPTFASLLRRARRAAGLTQEALAERAGISVDAISALERGLTHSPHADTLERLSEALQLSPEERAQWEQATVGLRLLDDGAPLPLEGPSPVSALPPPALSHPPPTSALPTGTVTLLFTDIEGSTRLLQQLGNHYAALLDATRRLMREAFDQWHGHEVDTQGDAFFVAFARASDALAAAVAVQRALKSAAWPEGVSVRVRIGLHTGEPERSAEGYVGLDVHRAARIMSAGHGGQVLLSQATCDLVEHVLPEDVRLQDLGEHRLKDLSQPTRLFQLVIGGLPADFPPLKTLDTSPNNLPILPTPFMGRAQEGGALRQHLLAQQVRLLTLTGPGGVGKTRLALHLAAEVTEHFADGVWFVSLAPLSDPTLVIPTISQTLGMRDRSEYTPLDQLKDYLRQKRVLLLLDNFEQVAGAAVQVADLLTACSRLKILVTSREALHVRAEQEFAVPALTLPDAKYPQSLATFMQSEAVALFLARAQAAQPHFQLTPANAPTIAEICARLDGLPLALELAAPRLKLLSPQALLSRLEERWQVLGGGARDLPERQRTMHATIQWSYDLLTPAEQALFRRLAVFVGGWTLEAAEQVCLAAGGLDLDVLEGLASLLDKSLLRQEQAAEGEMRFRMLYVLREFGLERLEAEGELMATRETHAASYLALAEEAEPHLQDAGQQAWWDRLEQEYDNLRAALNWWLERAEQAAEQQAGEHALRLCGALLLFWSFKTSLREGLAFLERALARRVGVAEAVQVKAVLAAAQLLLMQDEFERGEALAREGLALARQGGDPEHLAFALFTLGAGAIGRDQYAVSQASWEEAAVIYQQTRQEWMRGNCLWNLALLAGIQGEYERERALYEERLTIYRTLGDQQQVGLTLAALGWALCVTQSDLARGAALAEQGVALVREGAGDFFTPQVLYNLGSIRRLQGRHAEAGALLEESLILIQRQGAPSSIFETQNELARLLHQQGELVAAQALYQKNQALLPTSGYRFRIADYLEGRGALEAALGRPRTAARLWGTAEALREAIGAPMYPIDRDDYAQVVAAARTQLGEAAFAAAWAEGRSMTPEQALAVSN